MQLSMLSKFSKLLMLFTAIMLRTTTAEATATPRTRSSFDFGWRFQLGNASSSAPAAPGFDDASWRKLDVPHDFVLESPIDKQYNPNHGARARNVSWYRKTFEVGAALQHQMVSESPASRSSCLLYKSSIPNWFSSFHEWRRYQ